jgi:hypothetical protein
LSLSLPTLERLRRAWRRREPEQAFLLGHPKSGTTIIATLLASASGCSLMDDLFHRAGVDRATMESLFSGDLALAELVQRYPRAFRPQLIKCPKLTYFLPELRSCFPAARFAYIVRDPRAALRSYLGWRAIPGNAACLNEPWQNERVEVLPRQPPGHYITRLAQRWNQAADIYLRSRETFALIRYEDFVREPAAAIKRLAIELHLDTPRDVSDRVHVAYKRSGVRHIPFSSFFGKANLERIESTCSERMAGFGYV